MLFCVELSLIFFVRRLPGAQSESLPRFTLYPRQQSKFSVKNIALQLEDECFWEALIY
jgi:hypothetical protein